MGKIEAIVAREASCPARAALTIKGEFLPLNPTPGAKPKRG
jgi:hypothetical protein